jgi:hypothetical protein
MATLSPIQKSQLLAQVQRQGENIDVKQIVSLINKYDNLKKEEFAPPILTPELYQILLDQFHDPVEMAEWTKLKTMPHSSIPELQTLEYKIVDYISRYQMAEESHVTEASNLLNDVRDCIADIREEERRKADEEKERTAWNDLDKEKYSELMKYMRRFPDTPHRDEIDDLLWNSVLSNINSAKLSRYLDDMPEGRHVSEANEALDSYSIWDEVKRQGDIIAIKDYMDNYPTSPFIREARNKYNILKDEVLDDMKESPSDYTIGRLQPLFDAGIFTKDELMDEGLITEHSWEMLTNLDRDMFPKIDQTPNPNIKAPEGCTDIFFFGTPSTGKTCLLMGLAGANGNGYELKLVGPGGQYIADLTIYANNGITPSSTFGSFVTVINGTITEEKSGRYINHNINLVEMSGEEFALKIAQNPENKVSFENMGTGATKLLMNDNRKVFFIIVDPTKLMIPFKFLKDVLDAEGNVVDREIRKVYISQNIILNKLTALFTLPENQKIMERVDAIHFIVTKADTLGDARSGRNNAAREKLNADYKGAVTQLKNYVRQSQRINASTDFKVQAYTFSLGRFYLGDVFELDNTDTTELIETIRDVTFGHKELSLWDRFKKILN